MSVSPVWNRGQVAGTVHIARDATERREIEEGLRKQHRILAAAERMAHLASFEWDFTTEEITVSEEFFRMAGREPLTAPISAVVMVGLICPADRWRMLQATKALRDGKEQHVEDKYEIIGHDGLMRGRAEDV